MSKTIKGYPVFIRNSPIQGLGCFAAADIPAGATIIEYTGECIDLIEAIRRADPSCPDYSPYIMKHVNGFFIDAARGGNEARFVNHSCRPNCWVRQTARRAFITASRPICKGEELTYDYAYDEIYRTPCRCGAPNCKGFI